MFKLEKLEISGFKSFADRTSLVFGEGITGVVGPNGCGKSNIAEAISWVLGEQSPKNLRGGKMEDVIFNGTRDRKPTGMAEVLLTMVAIEDIAGRDGEDSDRDDEQEYDQALTNAENAAEGARSLVKELAPEESADVAQEPEPAQGPQHTSPIENDISTSAVLADQSPVDLKTAEQIEQRQEIDSVVPRDEPSAIVTSEQTPARLEVESARDGSGTQEKPKPAERKRNRQPRKRRVIAISAGERIVVGRRLYRTGDSDYLMNGRPCLLRDIQDLFAGTGLGGAHYAIIEQGRIGQILSSKPLDRRALIEEAAGITKFKSRKRATELKLDSAKQNLTRLNDIISEVERQVNSLKRQAQKARRYRRLREEMRSLLKVIFTADYYRLNESIERVARELDEAEQNQARLDARLSELETEHRAASAEARAAEDQLAELRQRAAAVELEADRARTRRAFDEQQIAELTARIEEIGRDQQALDERLVLLEGEAQRRADSLGTLEAEVASEQADLLAREGAYQEELSRLRAAESDIEQSRQRMLTEIGMTERLRNLSANLEEALRRLEKKQASLSSELERAVARRGEASSEFERVGGEVEVDVRRIAELGERIAERSSELTGLRDQASMSRSRVDSVHTRRESAAHRLASLEDLDAHHAYYSDAVQHVLSREQAARINALGTLADFIEVEPQYERLIESLFARELQSILVPTIDDALAGVEFIKKEGLGRGAFLVVGLHGGEADAEGGMERDDDRRPGKDKRDGIEQWLVASESERQALLVPEEYVPEERQLPAADFSTIDAVVIQLHDEPESVNSDSRLESTTGADDRPAARRFDEEEASHASRFHLEVLRAIDLLSIRPEIKTVVERAFPAKCSAAVVPDIEAALHQSIENGSLIYVTYDGEQVAGGRLIQTGAQAGQKGTSLLGLKREIKQLREQTQRIETEEQQASEDLTSVEKRLRGVEAEASSLDQMLREHEKAAAARNSNLAGLERDLERAQQHVRVVEAELEQAAAERTELESRVTALASELAAAVASRDQVQRLLDEAGSRFVEMRAQVEELSQQLSGVRASVAARAERLQAMRAEVRRTESEAEELRSRVNRNKLEMYDSHNRIDSLNASLEEGTGIAMRFETERASLAELVETGSANLTAARSRTDELEQTLAELRQATAAAHDHRGHIEVEQARIRSEAEHLTRSCFSELAMSLEDVVTSAELAAQAPEDRDRKSEDRDQKSEDSEPPLASDRRPVTAGLISDIESARARHDELRVKLDEMGPVNMMALEELEESDERFRFLTEQRRDILDSIKMTEEALSEIKRRSRERFRHAFAHINENFQRMFVELFGGGRGEMMLIDEDDVLESGIDLIAQPPGKRLQNVLLLSGGEKAMAAIALVLAIFQYRPSPFCILDEVDAPLDEVNVGRFADKVIEMSTETQFLMITHNKRTMESARALYGVTMEEPGVSKLVSVKF
ncbi:MAG TPA: AAA family ATPase [Blastocatellia bacterium]|nr:AAA family ATPase [Blastocatellia bacterium]